MVSEQLTTSAVSDTTHIAGHERFAQHVDGVFLCGDIVDRLGSAGGEWAEAKGMS